MAIVESHIDSVTVYQSGATISRLVELKTGPEGFPDEVEIPGLPLALLDPMLRVYVERVEPAEAKLFAGDVRVGLRAEPRGEVDPDSVQEQLEALERQILGQTQKLRQLELESAYLSMMEVPDRPRGEPGKPPPAAPISARVMLEEFADEATGKRLVGARELRASLSTLEKEAAKLRDRLQRASSAQEAKPHELSKTVIARLIKMGTSPSSARLRIDYLVPGARWAPTYQCRLSRDCRAAEIVLRALVAQRSGEDWSGVAMTLSTALPLSWTELPELSSIRIGRAQTAPPPPRGFRPPPRGAGGLFVDHDRDRQLTAELVPASSVWQAPSLLPALPDLVPERDVVEELFAQRLTDDRETPEMLDDLEAEDVEEFTEDETFGVERFTTEMPPAAPAPAPAPADGPMYPMSRPARLAADVSRAAPSHRRGRRRPSAQLTRQVQALGEEGAQEAAATALLFSQLRLGDPEDDGARNRLLPIDTRANYLEMLTRSHVAVHVDVLSVVNQAQQLAADVAALPLPEGAADVRRAAGTFDYSYRADTRVDVESDGMFHSIALGARRAESDVTYVVVPREDTSAYRLAALKNPLEAPLLPGPAEVHVGGDYVLTTTLPKVAARGEFTLGLGVEQSIKVARNTTFSEARSGSKVVAMTELSHGIEIELFNHLGRKVRCEVRERIPQPAGEAEVVVEELAVEPPWELYDQTERRREVAGGRRWKVEIGAGEAKTLRAGYVVKIYANNELVGGNRRED